ncbi:MAG: hypothetical protein AAF481_20270, partial [Acidobacteriota bacterium]
MGRDKRGHQLAAGLLAASLAPGLAAEPATHPFNADDLVGMARLSSPQVSPDGRSLVYVLRTTDLEANR